MKKQLQCLTVKPLLVLVFWCSATMLPFANGKTTHEETVVRATYAKLAYAAQLTTIHKALRDPKLTSAALNTQLAAERIQFHLSDFSTGKITDLADRRYADLVAKPTSTLERVPVTVKTFSFRESTNDPIIELGARAEWTAGGPDLTENWDIPAWPALAQIENAKWYSRYAALTVTVEFQGKSRTYKALFLFGRDDVGEEQVLPIDTVIGNSLMFFVKPDVYPTTLLKTNLRGKPAGVDWLKSQQVSDASCQAGHEKTCCDLATLSCGVASQDINDALAKPLTEFHSNRPVSQAASQLLSTPKNRIK